MKAVHSDSEQNVILHDISWKTYESLLADVGDRPIRLTYDTGTLEIMSPSEHHEWVKRILGRLIEALTLDQGKPIRSLGSMTLRRRRLKKGLEPDEGYYIANEPKVRGRAGLDLLRDPPPDIVIEVEVGHRDIDRLRIYAAMGVPEVWYWRRGKLESLHLGPGRAYSRSTRSLAFPELDLAMVARFVELRTEMDENSLVRAFLGAVRTKSRRRGRGNGRSK